MSLKCLSISDFNLDNFNAFLANSDGEPEFTIVKAPFGQVQQLLMDRDAACWSEIVDLAMVWVQPHAISESFTSLLEGGASSADEVLADIDVFAEQLAALTDRASMIFVPSLTMPALQRGCGIFDVASTNGARHALMRMNLRLSEKLRSSANIHVLNASQWTENSDAGAFNPKLWYMAKMAFNNPVFKHAAADVKMAVRLLRGEARKLIILDLDNTLWGGVVGDVGWESLTLGGHDAAGEAYVDFQQALKSLQKRGVVLALASKNTESVALEAIDRHPEMVLKRGDFASWRINWSDKAQNIVELAAELNLGLQSTVFIDDNPAERARVAETLSEVLVPEWPVDPLLYRSALTSLSCFDSVTISAEDKHRSKMYQEQKQRQSAKSKVGSVDDWLMSLDTSVSATKLDESNLVRASQLLNKTNQMNLSTRRLPQPEFMEWAEQIGNQVWTLTVVDRFGSQGLTGICSVEEADGRLKLVDFVLSCRVMGRKIEEAMLSIAIRYAVDKGLSGLDAYYLPTQKNQPCLDFFKRSGMTYREADQLFQWECDREFETPPQVQLATPDRPV